MIRAAAVALATGLTTAGATAAMPDPSPSRSIPVIAEVTRAAGVDRYETAAALSATFNQPGVDAVAIVGGAVGVDALAAALVGPVLLVQPDGVPAATVRELARLDPARVVVVGGTAAVSSAVERTLAATYDVARVAGVDRFETAAEVVELLFPSGAPTAYVTDSADLDAALVVAASAVRDGVPLLLSDRGRLPAPTSAALAALGALVTAPVEPDGAVVALLASSAPDALAAAAVGAPLAITERTCVRDEQRRDLEALRLTRVVLVGGTAAVTDAVGEMRSCVLPDTVTYAFGVEVTVAQRAYVRGAVDAARRRWGDPGPLVVQAYTDRDELVAANVRSRGGDPAVWRAAWDSGTTALGSSGWLAVDLVNAISSFGSSDGFMSLVAHEVGHALQLRWGGVDVPEWLLEGGAEWLAQETAEAEDWGIDRDERVTRAVRVDEPLSSFDEDDPDDSGGEYALGWAGCEYLAELAGDDDALLVLFESVAAGAGWEDVLQLLTGVTLDRFYAGFAGWLAAQ